MAVRKITIPGQNVPIQIGNSINPDWYGKLKFLEQLGPLSDIPPIVPPAPLTPGSTSVAVTTAAISDASLPSGTVHNYVSWDGTAASARDSFGTIAAYINAIRADLLASQTAVAALSTRVTALENKANAIITSLA